MLIAKECTGDLWNTMWTPKLIDHFTKIRNCIVHAREKRENKVILPTKQNDLLLFHYIPILDRMARQLVNMTA